MKLDQVIPALPVTDMDQAVGFYSERLGFEVAHHDSGFAVVTRDEVVLHLWQAGDVAWRERSSWDRPVQSGAESFIAGTASCRIRVDDVRTLFEEMHGKDVLHQMSLSGVTTTDFGTREFHTLDPDGNLVTFFTWLAP
jgi:catechol 2,3-dioxygenase-like lactoylglutathione lyase family enzyme